MGKFRISMFGGIQSIYGVTTTMLELNLDNRQAWPILAPAARSAVRRQRVAAARGSVAHA